MALISTSSALGIKTAQDVEVVLVVDRVNTLFTSGAFFVFKLVDDSVVIKWCDSPPHDGDIAILAKVVLCTIPWVEGMRKTKSGFLEDDEEDD